MDQPYDPAWTIPIAGAVNGGATCWGNAILQALGSVPQFVHAVIEEQPKPSAAAALYQYFAREQPLAQASVNASTGPLSVITALASEMPIHNACADEGITLLLDQFTDVTQQLFDHAYMWDTQCSMCDAKNSETRDVDKILKIPPVLNASARDVELHNRKLRDLPSNHPMYRQTFIPQFNNAHDMAVWIRVNGSITDEWKCEKCNRKAINVPRAAKLVRLNAVLMIRLDQIYGGHVTNWFPTLSFPGIRDDGSKYQRQYRLVAVVERSGGASAQTFGGAGGHYWARVFRRGRWYLANDATVQECAAPTPNPNALILFYVLS